MDTVSKGAFINYIDKKRWVGSTKNKKKCQRI